MKISDETSQKIKNMGLVCSILVVCIHSGFPNDNPLSAGWFCHQFVSQGVARIAVPFFFLVSGFFFAAHFDDRSWYRRENAKRLKTLLVPYVFWCLAAAAAAIPLGILSDILAGRPFGTNVYFLEGTSWIRAIGFDLTDYPIHVPPLVCPLSSSLFGDGLHLQKRRRIAEALLVVRRLRIQPRHRFRSERNVPLALHARLFDVRRLLFFRRRLSPAFPAETDKKDFHGAGRNRRRRLAPPESFRRQPRLAMGDGNRQTVPSVPFAVLLEHSSSLALAAMVDGLRLSDLSCPHPDASVLRHRIEILVARENGHGLHPAFRKRFRFNRPRDGVAARRAAIRRRHLRRTVTVSPGRRVRTRAETRRGDPPISRPAGSRANC